jgi:hypothetical protein
MRCSNLIHKLFWPSVAPKSFGEFQRFDVVSRPPSSFISHLMELPMMRAAERDSKFVTDLHAECSRLGKAQMMRIRGLPAADKASF